MVCASRPLRVFTFIVTVPGFFAVTFPVELTVAIEISEEVHVNEVFEFDGDNIGVSTYPYPRVMYVSDGRDIEAGASSTLILHEADSPLFVFTVTTVVP